MKKLSGALLLGTLLVGFQSFASASAFEMELESNPAALFHSKRYEKLIPNDDGRVTIVKPQFGSPDGQVKYISDQSSYNGLCALYGYGAVVETGTLTKYISVDVIGNTVVIDASSKFSKYGEMNSYGKTYYITHLMCETGKTAPASVRLEKVITNDDGRFTIVKPMFGSPDGGPRYISDQSDYNGVCKFYGYGKAVQSGTLTQYISTDIIGRTVVIDASKKFSKYGEINSYSKTYYITHLMCDPS